MARNTLNTLLQKAIPHAILDRESLVDAYDRQGQWAEEALAAIKSFRGLSGLTVRKMSTEQQRLAGQVFIYAEQWEQSFADSGPGQPYEAEARANVELYRAMRLKHWGQTGLEQALENAELVDTRSLFKRRS